MHDTVYLKNLEPEIQKVIRNWSKTKADKAFFTV